MRPLRVHLCIDQAFAEKDTSGLVRTWACLLPEATRHPDLEVTAHFMGREGHTRALAPNVQLREHAAPPPTTAWLERLGFRVPVQAGLFPYQATLAKELAAADVVHTTYTLMSFALTAVAVARWRGIPLVHSHQTQVPQHAEAYVRDAVERLFGRSRGEAVARSVRRVLEGQARWYFRRCSRILLSAPTDYAKLPTGFPTDRVAYLGRGIDTAAFHPARRDRALLRARFGIAEDEPVVLFVGKIMPDKNVSTLAHALAALAAQGERFTLLLCGEGGQQREVEALLGRRVVAAGVQRHDTLPWIYASADVFAFPSTAETYAQVVVEAMCSGLPPVVSAREGACQHIVLDGKEGVVVDDDGPAAWARALRGLLRDPDLRRRIGAAARARVESSASDWAAIFDRVVKPCWLAAADDARRRRLAGNARLVRRALALGIVLATAMLAACGAPVPRRFPDRPVAWSEQDEAHVPNKPTETVELRNAQTYRYFFARMDKALALEPDVPAQDVNALDEVPRSTWYVPRNHLHPVSPEEIFAGPPWAKPPVPPFRIVQGKDTGKSPGAVVVDAQGRKYMLKLDVAPYAGLMTGAEAVASRLAYAAGYYVPGSFVVELDESELSIDPSATYRKHGFTERPYTREALAAHLGRAARTRDGKLRAVAVAWVEGEPIGPYDFMGTRRDDPNDRIPHEHRRSLRATYVILGWLNDADQNAINTLDTYVNDGARRFVRHYRIDFGASLGSATTRPKDLPDGREYMVDLVRGSRSLISLGIYRRAWQDEGPEYIRDLHRYPELGYLPAEEWDASEFVPYSTVPPHTWMTDRDAYWGAKVVTSFTDDQIRAAVRAGGYSPEAAARLVEALAIRRDRIGARYLTRMTAVEEPVVDPDGQRLCFRDLAIARGYAPPHSSYRVDVHDEGRHVHATTASSSGERTCVRLPAVRGEYREVTLRATVGNRVAKSSRVHLAWRRSERRFVVVGLEREE